MLFWQTSFRLWSIRKYKCGWLYDDYDEKKKPFIIEYGLDVFSMASVWLTGKWICEWCDPNSSVSIVFWIAVACQNTEESSSILCVWKVLPIVTGIPSNRIDFIDSKKKKRRKKTKFMESYWFFMINQIRYQIKFGQVSPISHAHPNRDGTTTKYECILTEGLLRHSHAIRSIMFLNNPHKNETPNNWAVNNFSNYMRMNFDANKIWIIGILKNENGQRKKKPTNLLNANQLF